MPARPFFKTVLTIALLVALCLNPLAACAESASPVRLEDDFYTAVNAEWLAQAKISPDSFRINPATEATEKVEQTLMRDFDAMIASGKSSGDPVIDKFLLFYELYEDYDKRDRDGFAPARADFSRIENLRDLGDLSSQAADWLLGGMPMPFALAVAEGMDDVTVYELNLVMADPFLPDKTFYEAGNPMGELLLPLAQDAMTALAEAAGFDEARAREIVAQAFAFDALIVGLTPDADAELSEQYNHIPYEDFAAMSDNIDFGAVTEALIGAKPAYVNALNLPFFEAFDAVYSEENFENMRAWMEISFLMSAADTLSEAFAEPMQVMDMLASGTEELPDGHKTAYRAMSELFRPAIGRYYGRMYFGDEAKRDVTDMVTRAIAVYRERLLRNDWLGDDTREMAVRKLDALSVRVGYPEEIPAYFDEVAFTPAEAGGTLYGNVRALEKLLVRDALSKFGTSPDRNEWITSGDVVNAYYNPGDNSINFPAGILQAPYYSPDQSESANLGGIGMVIGHEISHAFDTIGAQFDEVGNFRDWWTEEDFAEFMSRAQAMVALFDGVPYAGSHVNGKLTLAENIADAGGLSCMYDVVASMPDGSLSDFYRAYAAIWRNKMTPEMALMRLTTDTHSPNEARVNVQCANSDGFYEAFDIRETDAMYIPPEERVRIW